MTDRDEGHSFPPPFSRYMLKGFPSGEDWEALRVPARASHLRREYQALHASQRNGGDLLPDFIEDLDRGVWAEQQAKGLVVQRCPWSVVNEILGTVENTRGMARHVRCLEYFQDPPKSRPGETYADWCQENQVTERHAYELRDGAILAVWLRVVRWARKV